MSPLLLHLHCLTAFVAVAFLIGSQAFSQVTDPSQTTTPITLPPVVISATRSERPLSGLPCQRNRHHARGHSQLSRTHNRRIAPRRRRSPTAL